jgi:hypothetical protein
MAAGLPSISGCVWVICAAMEDGPYGSLEWRCSSGAGVLSALELVQTQEMELMGV